MGVRFRKSKSLGKFGKVNLTRGGLGFSVGFKGARVGIGPRGVYTSVGIPGTGIYAINYAKQEKKTSNDKHANKVVRSLRLPKELKTSSFPVIMLFVSLFLIMSQQIIGLLGLAGSITWLIRRNKTPKVQAQKAFKEGMKHLYNNENDKALKSFEDAMNYPPAITTILPHVSDVCFKVRDFHKAAKYLEEYLKIKTDDVLAKFNYALALSHIEKYNEAIEVLQNLPEEFKKELPVIIALGYAFIGIKKPELAIEILETGPTRKRNMDGHMIPFRYILGCAYKETGNKEKAINQLQKVYAVDANFEQVRQLLEELQKD